MKHTFIYVNQVDLHKKRLQQRHRDEIGFVAFGFLMLFFASVIIFTMLHSI